MSPPFGFYPYSVIRPRDTSRGLSLYMDLSLRRWRTLASPKFGCTRHSQASLPLLSLARKFARMPHFGPRSSYPQRKLPPTFHALGILCLSSATQIIRPCGQRGFNAVGQWQVYSQDYSPHPVTGFAALLRKECGDCRLYVHSLRQSFASQSSPSPSIAVHLDQSAEQLQELSRKLAYALSFAYRPTLSITFFQPDSRKTEIPLDAISDIQGEIFNDIEI